MHRRIQERLKKLETEYGFRVLYACESGSRAWGFASADSDYDVRFITVWPRDCYLSVSPPQEDLDLGIDAENLDFSAWDLRKALRLFAKSNGALIEWLHSPIVYRAEEASLEQWRALLPTVYDPKASASHYLGMFKNSWRGGIEQGKVTAKVYLYALRALLAAEHVLERKTVIPVPFGELAEGCQLPTDVSAEIASIIATKSSGEESDAIQRNLIIDAYVQDNFTRLEQRVTELEKREIDIAPVDEFFRRVIEHS